MNGDLDTRGRDAAAAAKASVAQVGHAEQFRPVVRQSRRVAMAFGGLALMAVAVLTLRGGEDPVATFATGPSEPGTVSRPGPPGGSPFGPGIAPDGSPIGVPLTSGFAGDRFRWALYAEGPSRTLCLAVQSTVDTEGDRAATVCEQPTSAGAAPDPNRPLVLTDPRVPSFVFGRLPADVAEVSVVLGDGNTLARQAPAQTPIGQVYVVEVPDRKNLRAVGGYRKDGTSVRFDY